MKKMIENLIKKKNDNKIIFTAGPASIIDSNIINLGPCFGRGDNEYNKTYNSVIKKLKKISGLKKIITTQGSGSTALEIVALNFFKGKILIVSTGYYSDRLFQISNLIKKNNKKIKSVTKVNWKNLDKIKGKYDWIWACSTETSRGLKIPITDLKQLTKRTKSKLALDATASIGLESNHHLADVISFSSCKGLFGLTGACFVCYNINPTNKVNTFVLDIKNLEQKRMTGPYHTIQSLEKVLKKYNYYKKSVVQNKKKMIKKFKDYLVYPKKNQPFLCTYVNKKIISNSSKVILYKPRIKLSGSIVCHIGEAHLGKNAKGKIIDFLDIDE